MNEFEQFSSDDLQMSLEGFQRWVPGLMSWRTGGVSKSNVWVGGGARVLLGLYSQIECIMGNGHIETPL